MINSLMLSTAMLLGQTQVIPPAVPTTSPTIGSHRPIYTLVQNGEAKAEEKNGNGNGAAAEEKKEEEKPADEGPWRLCPDAICGFKMTGWLYGTGVYNATNGGNSRYNGPMTQNDQTGVYLNQLWLNFNKGLEKDCAGWGANLDVFFGNDYLASESRGFENRNARGWVPHWWDNKDYGIAIPQAYVEFGTTSTNFRVGHFYTPHGYMVVQATGNFFNTLPYGFMMTNPFTHWGALGNIGITDEISLMVAVVNGWDALDRPVNTPGYMGGFKYSFKESKGFYSTTVYVGQEPENLSPGYSNRTLITNVLDYKLTDNLEFVLENNLLWQENENNPTSFSWSIIPYVFYKLNDCWKIGARYECFYDPTGFMAGIRVGNPNVGPYNGYVHSFTGGLNWTPGGSKNLMIRPEIKYDLFNGNGLQPFSSGAKDHQIMMMLGAIYQF